MNVKNFAIKAAEFKALAIKRGSCLATDRITVDRQPVGWMYRENPTNEIDSGWRFFAGDESDEYVSDPANFRYYGASGGSRPPA